MSNPRTMLISTLAISATLVYASGARADLVGYWNFDDNVADWSGMGNNGVLQSGAGYSGDFPAQIGGGKSLGITSNGGGVVISSPTGLNSSDFTLSYWIKDPGQTASHNRITARAGYSFETAVGDSAGRQLRYYPAWTDTGGFSTPGWTHVAYVHAGTTLKAYVDGNEVYTGNVALAPSGDMGIGVRITGGPGESFLGNIDDVALWNKPLQVSAVRSLAAGTQAPAAFTGNETGLVGYWTFDGDTLDHSNNGNDGVLLGGAGYSGDAPRGGQSLSVGAEGEGVVISSPTSLDSGAFTLSYWIKDPGQIASNNRITSRGGNSFETAVGNSAGRQLRYYPSWTDTGGTSSPDWTHVAYVYNDATVRTYVNGSLVHTRNDRNFAPAGDMGIGVRIAGGAGESFLGNIDDVAMWNAPLTASAIQALVSGHRSPDDFTVTTVTSDPAEWMLSTVRTSGGPAGTWTPSGAPPPDASTFTLPASPSPVSGILAAAADLGVGTLLGDGGAGQPTGVQYYRTTFDLAPFEDISANIVLAVDNGAQVFINGIEVARETSYLVENWARPYSSLTINADGSITNLSLFEPGAATSFTGWRIGRNELILALRNSDSEGLNAGGIAFRMDIVTSVPEPGSIALLGLGGLALAVLGWRRRTGHTPGQRRASTASERTGRGPV